MTGNRFSFTANRLAAVAAPFRGATYVYDTVMPGLAMRVTPGGARTFVLYRRLNGRPTRINLGAVDGMSVLDARKAVQQIAGKVAAGVNIVAERRAARVRGRTVGDAFTAWIGMAKHRKRSWDDDRRLWEIWVEGKPSLAYLAGEEVSDGHRSHIAFPSFAKRPLSEVTTGEIENITRRIGATNPRTANKLRALLSTVWNHAIRRGETTSNPVRFVERFPEQSRERYLKENELEAFLRAVAAEPPTWRDYFLIALLTGQRRENVSRMRWDEIDFDSAVWHIPATKTKNRRATAVPLTELAAALLSRRQLEVIWRLGISIICRIGGRMRSRATQALAACSKARRPVGFACS